MEYGMRIFKYDDDWICEFPDLPGCTGVGKSPEEAVEDGKIAKELWLEAFLRKKVSTLLYQASPQKNIVGNGFSGNLASNDDDWRLVRQPVTWQEAIQAWVDGKKVVWEEDMDRRVFDRNKGWLSTKHQVQMIDQDGDAVTVRMISRGKWYVED